MIRTRIRLKRKFIIFLAVYAVLFTSYFSMRTFSKYTGRLDDKTGSMDVAKWSVSMDTTGSNSNLSLISGNNTASQTYTLSVTSTSEVALSCSLVATNVPNGVKINIGSSTVQESSGQITIDNFGSFDASDQNSTKNYTLTFIAPIGTASVSNHEIDMDVICVQKQL